MIYKSNFVAMLLCFSSGVALASGYFLFFKDSTRVSSAPKQAVISSANTQVNNQPTTLQGLVQVNKAQVADQQTQLAQHVVELNQRLEKKSIQLKQSQQQLKLNQSESVELDDELAIQFEQEADNLEWSYELEVALTDFLIINEFADSAELTALKCKQTICKFELTINQHAVNYGAKLWRELNDKLHLEPWWQQFKLSASQSNDARIEFTVSTQG